MRTQRKENLMETAVVLVNPEMALEWLTSHNNDNRRVRKATVARYATAMRRDEWVLTNQGIGFDVNGRLVDGQHRLRAIIEAEVAIPMMVVYGLEPGAFNVVDGGLLRGLHDVAPPWARDSAGTAAIAKAMMAGLDGLRNITAHRAATTRADELAFMDRHREALEYAATSVTKGVAGLSRSTVLAAIGRAYYHLDRALLDRAGRVLRSGLPETESDQPVILLRNALIQGPRNGGGSQRLIEYAKTERTLVALRDGEELSKLYVVKSEQFPLPS